MGRSEVELFGTRSCITPVAPGGGSKVSSSNARVYYGPEFLVPSLTLLEGNRVLFQLVRCYLGGLIRADAQLERISQRLQIALVHRHV